MYRSIGLNICIGSNKQELYNVFPIHTNIHTQANVYTKVLLLLFCPFHVVCTAMWLCSYISPAWLIIVHKKPHSVIHAANNVRPIYQGIC